MGKANKIFWVGWLIKLDIGDLIVAGVGLGGWLLSSRSGLNSQHAQAATGQSQQRPAVPVLASAAETKNFPVIVRGIGTVEAFNTVTVKSRIDGNIVRVAYTEGQFVHTGDLLVQIDPRPYQAQLEQAEANKAKDHAGLENAQRDLARYAALLKTNLAVTRQQYDTQQATVDQLKAAVQADQAQITADQLNVAYLSITSTIWSWPGRHFRRAEYVPTVQVNPAAMAARGIGIDDVANAITNNTVELPVGALQGPSRRTRSAPTASCFSRARSIALSSLIAMARRCASVTSAGQSTAQTRRSSSTG